MALALVCAGIMGCAEDAQILSDWEHATTGIIDAELSPNGQYAVVSSFDAGTGFWDLDSQTQRFTWRHRDGAANEISQIAFSPNSSHVLTGDARTFVIWDTQSGAALGFWEVDADITALALSRDARYVLLGLKDGRAIHIDQTSYRRLEVIAHQKEAVSTVAMSPDGRIAATGGNDKRVMVWDALSGEEIHAISHSHRIIIVEIDPRGEQLLTADEKGNAHIWSLASGEKRASLELGKRQHVISAAEFSADGRYLLGGFPGRDVKLWDCRSGKLLQSWQTPKRTKGWVPQGSTVYAVAFNDLKNAVLASSSNGLGRTWAVRSPE